MHIVQCIYSNTRFLAGGPEIDGIAEDYDFQAQQPLHGSRRVLHMHIVLCTPSKPRFLLQVWTSMA